MWWFDILNISDWFVEKYYSIDDETCFYPVGSNDPEVDIEKLNKYLTSPYVFFHRAFAKLIAAMLLC